MGPFDVASGSKQEAAIAVSDRDAQIAVMQMKHDEAVDAKRREEEGLGPAVKAIDKKAKAAHAAGAKEAGPEHRGGKSDVPGVAGLQIDAECGPTVGIKCGQTVFNNGFSAEAGKSGESDAAAARAAAAKVAEAEEAERDKVDRVRLAEAKARTEANAGPAQWLDQLRNTQAAGT